MMGGGALSTAMGIGMSSGMGVGAGVLALGGGAALMAHQKLSQMRQSGAPLPELPLTQRDIPDETIRSNLSVELADRYAILGEPGLRPIRDKLAENIFNAWSSGRLVDPQYPDLRGCVTEALIEAEVAKVIAELQPATGAAHVRVREGLQKDLGNRARRWAPLRVEDTAASRIKELYPAFETPDCPVSVAKMAKAVYDNWFKQGSPALMDRPGPATPLLDNFIHDYVQGFMGFLASKPTDLKLTTLLRELRKSERQRSMASSTLFTRLQKAGRELEILSAYAAHLQFPNDTLKLQVTKTLEALRQTPEVMSKTDLDRYAGVQGLAGQEGHVKELAGRLGEVMAKAAEARTKEDAGVRERLKWMQRVVAGTGAVAGLEADAVGSLHPVLPDWARKVSASARGAQGATNAVFELSAEGTAFDKALGLEIQFRNGSWWLRDGRVLSRINALIRRWNFTVNGHPLPSEGHWPVRPGDRVLDREGNEIAFNFPEEPPLEKLRQPIARASSLQDLADLLKANGQRSLGQQIESYLNDGDAFTDIPQIGGLRAKLTDLVLKREASLLHERYFLNLSYSDAETVMAGIAQAVATSTNVKSLAEAVAASKLPGGSDIAQAIISTEAAGKDRQFDTIPTAFGIRERLILFLRENERILRAHLGKLGGDVSRLSGELRNAQAGIANRDKLLEQSAAREANLNTELQRARESLTAQEELAKQEKERLLAAQKAELARINAAVQALKNEHAATLRSEQENAAKNLKNEQEKSAAAAAEHARLQRDQAAAHESELARKTDDMTRQAAEHKRLQDAKDAAHRAALDAMKSEHATALAGKDQAYEELKRAATEQLAERDRLHREASATAEQQHVAALASAAQSKATALETQRKDYETRLEKLEARRAETAEQVTQLQGQLAALNAEKEGVERVRDEKEAARVAAQAEVTRLAAEETRLKDELSKAGATAGSLRTKLQETTKQLEERRLEVVSLTGERDTAQGQVNNLEERLRTSESEESRLLTEVIPGLEQTIDQLRTEARKTGADLAEIDVAFAAMEDYLGLTGQIASTDDYIKRIRQIKEALEARLAASEAPVVDEAEIEAVEDADEGPVTRVDIKLPATPPEPPPAVKEKPTLSTSAMERLKGPFFGDADPRNHRVEKFEVMGTKDLHSMDGQVVGQAWIRGGNLRDDTHFSHTYADGSILSAMTSIGVPKRPTKPGEQETQEDGLYIASYRLPDGREVKIISGADGAGGMGGGDLASSSFLQGIHAAVHEAAAHGRSDLTAGELFEAGNQAVLFQKNQPDRQKAQAATGSAGVIVVIGNVVTVATVGDAMFIHSRRQADGSQRIMGYSDADHMHAQYFGDRGKGLTRGIGMDDEPRRKPHLYAFVAQPDDRFGFGSDGLHEVKLQGDAYKLNGSSFMRTHAPAHGHSFLPLSRAQLAAYEKSFNDTQDTTDAGKLLHDEALAVMKSGPNYHDNIFAVSFQQGMVQATTTPSLPAGYGPLESPWSPYVGGADPRTEPIQVPVQGGVQLYDRNGALIGGAVIAAGGQEGDFGFRLKDQSLISAQTSLGVPKPGKSQIDEDSFYTATFSLPDGTPVKVTSVADGAGGMGETGHVASSAFLQGVHAAVAEAAYSGRSDLTADELFEAGVQAVEVQNGFGVWDPRERARLGVGDGRSCTTASVVLMIGNRAMVATYGDATVFYAVPVLGGGFRVERYSNADYREFPDGKSDTSLVGYKPKREDDDSPTKVKFRRYLIDNVPDGAIFLTVSDGMAQALAGSQFPVHASEDMRGLGVMLGRGHIEPPNDNHFRSLNQLLGLVSGHDKAAQILHAFSKAMMEKALEDTNPLPVLNQVVPAPPRHKSIKDNLGVTFVQHRTGNYPPIAPPVGYEEMPAVVAVGSTPIPNVSLAIGIDRRPKNPDDKGIVIGRDAVGSDEVIDHSSVSRRHAEVIFNTKKEGPFEPNTWYMRPISDNPTGNVVDGQPVTKGSWVALRPGSRARLGGVPLMVNYGTNGALQLTTDTEAVAPSLRSPVPPPAAPVRQSPKPPPLPGAIPPTPPAPRTPSPVPPAPVSMRNPSQPPAYRPESNGSTPMVALNGLDELTFVSGSALDSVNAFAPVKGKAKSANFIAETGLMGGDVYLRVVRKGDGFSVENPHRKKPITIHPVAGPKEGVEIKPGQSVDLAVPMFVTTINGRVFQVLSE